MTDAAGVARLRMPLGEGPGDVLEEPDGEDRSMELGRSLAPNAIANLPIDNKVDVLAVLTSGSAGRM